MSKCLSTLKVKYRSRADAKRVADAMRSKSDTGFMEVYPCKFCGAWHVTSQRQIKPGQKRR